jgi:hypothetical protein
VRWHGSGRRHRVIGVATGGVVWRNAWQLFPGGGFSGHGNSGLSFFNQGLYGKKNNVEISPPITELATTQPDFLLCTRITPKRAEYTEKHLVYLSLSTTIFCQKKRLGVSVYFFPA